MAKVELTNAQLVEIHFRSEQGESMASIGRVFGVSAAVVKRRIEEVEKAREAAKAAAPRKVEVELEPVVLEIKERVIPRPKKKVLFVGKKPDSVKRRLNREKKKPSINDAMADAMKAAGLL